MFTPRPSKQHSSEAFEVQEHFSPLCSGPLVFEQGSCLVPDAKGPRPRESCPASISHLAPALCPFTGCAVGGPPGSTLGTPQRVNSHPGRTKEAVPHRRVASWLSGHQVCARCWAAVSPSSPASTPRQACPAPPLHRQGKPRLAKTPGVAHVHQAEE